MNESRPVADRAAPGAARERLRESLARVDRTETLPVSTAVGRPLADPVVARRPVPQFDQIARDGFAVRADDTDGASDPDPVVLMVDERIDGGRAVPVGAGDELPEGADAVLPPSAVESDDVSLDTVSEAGADQTDLTVTGPVESGDGVRETGADVAADEVVRPAGHQLTPSDPALCTAVGRTRVEVVQRPAVGIVPVGHGIVSGDSAPGETVETNGTTLAEYVERWGGKVTYRDPVSTDPHALRAAVERDLTKDLLVTVGGTGDGEFDRIADVVADLGEVRVDGVALDPGASTSLGIVRERPVISLPGDPVAAFVAMTRFVGPAVTRLAGRSPPDPRTVEATLDAPLDSEAGVESAVPVAFDDGDGGPAGAKGEPDRTVSPVADEPLSTLARADGWVAVPPAEEGLPAGQTVAVEEWEVER